ncbi:50S ribosomal protein L4 [Mesohalobacter halotolerans]|uniref:Large ribosomal subunit protein uL4 n=1 Tax=Mesohalobacter halotolerans TaxID=1883405 RepID=A0A4U5TNM0_9FLAO|nr:50S ribosomal protein L4 [Mesohalobacter halotolerans]MBS3738152.1 50S ribosomal protein L4 [Psychroflexus sp.]TKS55629.1 50S ribosomal protein L4 [Mesohalobacter halotolerans]
MKVEVLDIKGEKTGKTVNLSKDVFGVEPNDHAVYLDVKQHLASRRQGTHKAKERAEIKGSTRKIKKQKGTGTARAGSIKSPIFKGGGRVFGPQPRNYRFKLNKKLKRLARASALSQKTNDKELLVVENFTFDNPKTKEFLNVLENLKLENKKSVFVFADANNNVYLSSRNLKRHKVLTASELNTYTILNNDVLVLSESVIEYLEQNLNQ